MSISPIPSRSIFSFLGLGILAFAAVSILIDNRAAHAQQGGPTITSISPSQTDVGKPPKKIILQGSGFQSGASVEIEKTRISGKLKGQTFTLKGKTISASLFSTARRLEVVVVNPDGARSNSVFLTVGDGGGPVPARIDFGVANPTLNEGDTLKFNARVLDANGNPIASAQIAFESSSPDVVTIDSTGLSRGVKQGFATVTARSGNLSASITVTVTKINKGQQIPQMGNGEVKVDQNGLIYITDSAAQVIRRGQISTAAEVFAGAVGMPDMKNGPRIDARFNAPLGLAIDKREGSVYIADAANNAIRQLLPNGTVKTILGGPEKPGADDGSIASAKLRGPRGVAVGGGGSLYVSDTENNTIRFIDLAEGKVTTIAGVAGQSGLRDGPANQALFNKPESITFVNPPIFFTQGQDPTVLVADTGNRVIREVNLRTGAVKTVGPIPKPSVNGKKIEPNQTTPFIFSKPTSLTTDGAGNIYVVDDGQIFLITSRREMMNLAAGNAFMNPSGIDVRGNQVVVFDEGVPNDGKADLSTITFAAPMINRVTPEAASISGNVEVIVDGDDFGPDTRVFFDGDEAEDLKIESVKRLRLTAPAVAGSGVRTLIVLTRGGSAQKEFFYSAPSLGSLQPGQITTVAGGTTFVGDGGDATLSTLASPGGLSIDSIGNLLFADTGNNRIRRIDLSMGIISTAAGTGAFGNGIPDGASPLTANLTLPVGTAIDSEGNFYTNDFTSIVRLNISTGKIENVFNTGDVSPNAFAVTSIAIDSSDNIYVADADCNCIIRYDSETDTAKIFAGQDGQAGFDGDGGPAANALLANPRGVAIDFDDAVLIADTDNNRIRRIDADGTINTIAGNGDAGSSGDGGPAVNASLSDPKGIALDSDGNLLIADAGNNRVRLVDAETGRIDTIAGSDEQGGFSGDGGPADQALLNFPVAVTADGANNIFISDAGNNVIRVIISEDILDDDGKVVIPANTIFTVAGTVGTDTGDENVPALKGRLFQPSAIAFDARGNLYIADSNIGRIRIVDAASQNIKTIAGTRKAGGVGDGGPAIDAFLFYPIALAFDKSGRLLVVDNQLPSVRRIDLNTGIIERVAGTGDFGFSGDGGPAIEAELSGPSGIAVDAAGNIYIADTLNHCVRQVDSNTGIITTIVGNGTEGFDGDGGNASEALLSNPTVLAFDAQGNLFIGDSGNKRIRRVAAQTGIITTIAGTGELSDGTNPDGDGGLATAASFSEFIGGIVFDSSGNLYLSDAFSGRVRRINAATGIITTVVGTGDFGLSGDGGAAASAVLLVPNGLAFDANGNLFVTDQFNNRIRAVRGPIP